MKKVTHITYGLFLYRGIHFYRNLKDVVILLKRLFFLLKHGYTDAMLWSTSDWFISAMRDVLLNYRNNRVGTPVVIPDYNTEEIEENERIWNNILDRMIEYLSYMDESNSVYKGIDLKVKYEIMDCYKDMFFELYSKYFYSFWD